MRTAISALIFLLLAGSAQAEEFLGAPVIPGGKVVEKTDSVLKLTLPASHDEARRFYEERFKDQPDIRFRDWKEETYIEDDGNSPWHSVRISKMEKSGTVITIAKDSWTWIFSTLVLRFTGVFVVLLFLYSGMSIAGRMLSRTVGKGKREKA